jgi:ATP-binding cassette subfamily B protein
VFQETFMLNDSLYHNIAIGRPDATLEEVQAAAQAAQAHAFIRELPDGYDTLVGEGGVKLSGGEQQRVCIARAILKDAPIIVFDEATSFTDIENEHKIQLALSNLLKGRTAIMIAHRLHTIVHADQICVFEKGSIVERGTHDALLRKNGRYQKMWETYSQHDTQEVDA